MTTSADTAIRTEDFGALADGSPVARWTLERDGVRVRVLTYGAIVQSVEAPGRDGSRAPVALGLPDSEGTRSSPAPTSARWSGGTRTGSGARRSSWTGRRTG